MTDVSAPCSWGKPLPGESLPNSWSPLADFQRAADVTKLAFYRGEPFAWAWLANEGHPAYMGHITLAEMMAPLLTGVERIYPE